MPNYEARRSLRDSRANPQVANVRATSKLARAHAVLLTSEIRMTFPCYRGKRQYLPF